MKHLPLKFLPSYIRIRRKKDITVWHFKIWEHFLVVIEFWIDNLREKRKIDLPNKPSTMTGRIVNSSICTEPGISAPNRIPSAEMVTRICIPSKYIDYPLYGWTDFNSGHGLILKRMHNVLINPQLQLQKYTFSKFYTFILCS